MIIHRIAAGDCLSRQHCNYHKCHRCIFRGKASDWAPADNPAHADRIEVNTGERSVPTRTVEMPRPERQQPPRKDAPRKGSPRKPRKVASKLASPA